MGRLTNGNGGDPGAVITDGIDNLMGRIPLGLFRAALVLEGEWKQVLLTPGRGRVYGKHQASAPGDPPAPDTGTLQRSITHEVVDDHTIRVGTNIEYAEILEFGSLPRGSKTAAKAGRGGLGSRLGGIAPRPHARPAAARAIPGMTQALADEMKQGADFKFDLGGSP